MKPSDDAVAATSAFLDQDVVANADKLRPRVALDAMKVPQDDHGLRLLAANGDWASVISLADKLEDEAAAKSHSFFMKKENNDVTAANDGNPSSSPPMRPSEDVRVPSATAAIIARLPYVLVQVTAYLKMQRVGAAKKLFDTLGDLEGEDYFYPDTKENFAPFSLRFLAALMPFYIGVPMETQRKLYSILQECVTERECAAKPKAALWLHREARVRRALIFLHYTAGQYAVAIQHFHKLMAATDETNGLSSSPSTAASWPSSQRIQRVLVLQQLACLCLHCGALVHAQQAFEQVDAIDEATPLSASEKEARAIAHIKQMNEAFLLAFYGRFAEAAAAFREIAADAKTQTWRDSTGTEDTNVNAKLLDSVLTQVQANALISEAACMPYCQQERDPHTAIASLISAAEAKLKENPQVLASSDSFIADLVRLYTLAGNRKAKLEQLASVLEVFRSDAASLPDLEKLV